MLYFLNTLLTFVSPLILRYSMPALHQVSGVALFTLAADSQASPLRLTLQVVDLVYVY